MRTNLKQAVLFLSSLLICFRELLVDKNGKPYKEGDVIKNEKYANTLERIQEDPESFYNGQLAIDIVREMTRNKFTGKVTAEDLRNYNTEKREPLESELSNMKM